MPCVESIKNIINFKKKTIYIYSTVLSVYTEYARKPYQIYSSDQNSIYAMTCSESFFLKKRSKKIPHSAVYNNSMYII